MHKHGQFWFGVVKDRQDPLQLGRCRVKIFGIHTADTDKLPWAIASVPVTTAASSGVGAAPVGLIEGTTVFGFFRDEKTCQEPVILGAIPGYNVPFDETFNSIMKDDRTEDQLALAPRPLESVGVSLDGTGALLKEEGSQLENRLPQGDGVPTAYPKSKYENRPDTPFGVSTEGVIYEKINDDSGKFKREQNVLDKSYVFTKKSIAAVNIDLAQTFEGFTDFEVSLPDILSCSTDTSGFFSGVSVEPVDGEGSDCPPVESLSDIKQLTTSIKSPIFASTTQWDEPVTQALPVYPYNHVYTSESGHVIEIDDTPTVERLSFNHRSGSFYEIHPDGSTVQKVVGDNYTIVARNNYMHVEGEINITTDKGARIFINRDRGLAVEGENKFAKNFDILVGKGANLNIEVEEGNVNTLVSKGCVNTIIEEGDNTTVVKSGNNYLDVNSGDINVVGKNVNIKAKGDIQLHAEEEAKVLIGQSVCIEVKENANIKVGGNLAAFVDGTTDIHSGGNMTLESAADVFIKGQNIYLN